MYTFLDSKVDSDCDFSLTLLHAAERECILPHKVIFRCLVIVFHYKAHHGQLRSVDGEAQGVIPYRVEPYRKDKSFSVSTHTAKKQVLIL